MMMSHSIFKIVICEHSKWKDLGKGKKNMTCKNSPAGWSICSRYSWLHYHYYRLGSGVLDSLTFGSFETESVSEP